MKIAIGSDHRGNQAALHVEQRLRCLGHEPVMLGEFGEESRDYPDSAYLVGRALEQGKAEQGMLVCGSGMGVAIAANKMRGVRAVVAMDPAQAEMSRRHNDANVLCLSADRCAPEQLDEIIDAWLAAEFEGGRHQRRVEKISAIERGEDPQRITAGT